MSQDPGPANGRENAATAQAESGAAESESSKELPDYSVELLFVDEVGDPVRWLTTSIGFHSTEAPPPLSPGARERLREIAPDGRLDIDQIDSELFEELQRQSPGEKSSRHTTGEDGRLLFLAPGPGRVRVSQPDEPFRGLGRRAHSFKQWSCKLTDGSRSQSGTVTVTTSHDVTGRIVRANGALDPSIQAEFKRLDQDGLAAGAAAAVTLDGEGCFKVHLPSGDYVLIARGGTLDTLEEGLSKRVRIDRDEHSKIDVRLALTSRVWMTVVDSAGQPVPKVGIRLTQVEPVAGDWNANSTDQRGWVEFYGVLPGTYSVESTGAGGFVDEVPGVVVGEGIATVNAGQLVYVPATASGGESR